MDNENGNTPAEGAAAVHDSGASDAPQYATVDELNRTSEKLSNDVRAMLGRIPHMVQEQIKTVSVAGPEGKSGTDANDTGDTVDPKAEVTRLLKDEREAIARERQSVERQRIRASIESALIDGGANPQAVKLAADSLMMRNADKIKAVSNDLGESRVVYVDNEYSEGVPVNNFITEFLSSAEGAAVLQPQKSPSTKGVPNGMPHIQGEVVKMSRLEAATADPKLLKSGRVVFID